MNDQPLVSIITPCYNGERYLKRYFDAILQQTYDQIELVLVNDGSEDQTSSIVHEYKNKFKDRGYQFIYIEQENAGQAAALNRGLKAFGGKYLAWIDVDDFILPASVEERVRYLEEHPEIQMVRTDGWITDGIDTGYKGTIAKAEDKYTKDIFEELLFVKTYGCCGCYMMTTELFLECYPNREIYISPVGQNWQLLVPAASRSKCGYIDKPLFVLYEHSDSHSRKEHTNEENYNRWKNFTEVLCEAIKVSKCDQEKYYKLVMHQMYQQHFYIAVDRRDRKMLKQTYAGIKKYGMVSRREKALYFKCMLGK